MFPPQLDSNVVSGNVVVILLEFRSFPERRVYTCVAQEEPN
jgi:hypothetical protein